MFDLFTSMADPASPRPPAPLALATKAAGLPANRRPGLLMRAARHGAGLYRRERDLRALLPGMATSRRRGRDVAARLALVEAELEAHRRDGAPGYSVRRHVGVLSALLAERRALADRPA
ncbi:MAG: DUF6477 family protein [Pseudomonadota bacterium]